MKGKNTLIPICLKFFEKNFEKKIFEKNFEKNFDKNLNFFQIYCFDGRK